MIWCSEIVDLLKIICAVRLPVRIHKLDWEPRAVITLCGFWFCVGEKRLMNSLTKWFLTSLEIWSSHLIFFQKSSGIFVFLMLFQWVNCLYGPNFCSSGKFTVLNTEMLRLKQISEVQWTWETNAAWRLSAYCAWCMSTFRQLLKDVNRSILNPVL